MRGLGRQTRSRTLAATLTGSAAGICLTIGTTLAQAPASGCAGTPAEAIAAARAGLPLSSQTRGYRIESVRRDALQGQTWAIVRSCDHAERPPLTMQADLPPSATQPSVPQPANGLASAAIVRWNAALPAVHAGDPVRLSKTDDRAHIELWAVAEENGVVGARVRVRLVVAPGTDGQAAPAQYLAGVVRGPADVEMQ